MRILVQDLFGLERGGLTPAVMARGALGEPGQGQLLGEVTNGPWPSSSGPGPSDAGGSGELSAPAFVPASGEWILDH
jgi:hypothetical protein